MSTETVLRSSGVYTTLLGALNQFQAFTDLEYPRDMNFTTLNAKYFNAQGTSGVLNVALPPYPPILAYFGVGTEGFHNVGDHFSIPYPGDARMMDLYSPIPIRCVRIDEEKDVLPASERSKYRLRVCKTINGVPYALYYLKLIEFNRTIDVVTKDTDGVETPYAFDDSNLYPSPPAINETGGLIDTTVNRIIVRAKGTCTLRHDEIMEAVNVLYNGDTNFAKISEIGYYTGCDVDVSSDWTIPADEDTTTPRVFKEAVYVQLAKGHCYRGSELSTPNSIVRPIVTLESESCINGIV